MASSKELLRQIDDITECPICAESFKEPKVLPCIHTFCLHCLERYGKDKKFKNMGETMNCPLCRKEFTIPRSGLKHLPNNYFIIQLLQINQSSSSSKEAKQHDQCDICLQMSEKAAAAAFCVECHEHLCKACSGRHKIQKSSKTHRVVELQDKPSAEELMKMALHYCEQHPNKEIEFFCYDCKTTACVICYVNDKHNKHECCDVKKSADEFRVNLKQDMDRVAASALRTQEEIKQLEVELSRFNVSVDATRSEIAKKCDQIRSLIDKHQSQLMEKLSSLQQKHLKECETRKDELERLFVIKESFHRYCGELKDKGTSADISRAAGDLHVRADELLKSQEELVNVPSCSARITFTLSVADNINAALPDNIKDWIGEISFINVARSDGFEDFKATTFLSLPTVTVHNVPNFKGYQRGVAMLRNELFVACDGNTNIDVFDSTNFTLVRQIPIPDNGRGYALAACSHHNCLYLSTTNMRAILHRFDLSKASSTNWVLSDRCYGLSIARNFNLIVSLHGGRIQEYATQGKLIREILINGRYLFCSVQISSNNFVVSLADQDNKVCVTDSTGKILYSYGEQRGMGDGRLCRPYQLTVDKFDNVIVADYNNTRLMLLNPTLELLGYIETPNSQLNRPWAVHLDAVSRCLYIGELDSGRLLVLRANKT